MARVSFVFTAVVLLALVSLGESARQIECYECLDCEKEDLGNTTCQGKFCYMIEKKKYDRGCTDKADFCGPHAGMKHDCEVCMPDKCNDRYSGAAGLAASFLLPSLALALYRLL